MKFKTFLLIFSLLLFPYLKGNYAQKISKVKDALTSSQLVSTDDYRVKALVGIGGVSCLVGFYMMYKVLSTKEKPSFLKQLMTYFTGNALVGWGAVAIFMGRSIVTLMDNGTQTLLENIDKLKYSNCDPII